MKKYNLSKVMKRAWELVKKVGFGISEALKKAWKEAKETMMKGTEKQIAFAKNLMKIMNERFSELIAACPEENKQMWIDSTNGLNKIMNESYAGDVIDLLIDRDETNFMKYYKALCVSVSIGCSPLANRIKEEFYSK